MAQHNEFAWYRGEDVVILFTQTPVVDITGWTISFTLKKTLADAAPLLTIAATVGGAAPQGIYTVAVTAAQNTTLTTGSYVYSVTRTNSGSVSVLSEGPLTLKGSALLP
jgi:hypothetical protein